LPRHDDGQPPPPSSAEKGTTTPPVRWGSPVYQIRLRGQVHPRWSAWLNHLTITLDEQGDTLLTGLIVDQSALHGILTRIRDLGLPLISVMEIDSAEPRGTDDTTRKPADKENTP
jgi:hypothetical protein